MKYKTIIIVDGGYFRKVVTINQKLSIEDFTSFQYDNIISTLDYEEEDLLRILYYDCIAYKGNAKKPISGESKQFLSNRNQYDGLAKKDFIALRLGCLKFRGWQLKNTPINSNQLSELTDNDFNPTFEQKGVDMRIGLDIAQYSSKKLVDRIIVITNDTDFIPALKEARKNGVQIVTIKYAGQSIHKDFVLHSDLIRDISINLPES